MAIHRRYIEVGDRLISTGLCTINFREFIVEAPLEGVKAWRAGTLIQEALPGLTDDEREFLISGFTPAEWDALFPEEG